MTAHSRPVPKDLATFASTVLKDPKLLEQLTDRVYHRVQENLRQQQERHHHYGCRRSL